MRFRPTLATLAIVVVAATGVALLVARSGTDAVAIRPSATSLRAASLRASRTAIARIPNSQRRANAVARLARSQYRSEIGGRVQRATARGVAHNAALLAALAANRLGGARGIATSLLYRANHVSHIEVVRGGKSLVSVGKGFVVGAVGVPLRANLGTVDVSIQDVIGFVRLLHRRTGAEVIVRGNGGRVSSSLRAADATNLPASGAVSVAGRRYHASSFRASGLLGEPLSIWVLTRG